MYPDLLTRFDWGGRVRKVALAVVLATVTLSQPAAAASYAYGSCAEMPTQELAQETLDSPIYGTYDPPLGDPLNLDPDGDGIACNDVGNLVGEPPVDPAVDRVTLQGE